MKKELRKKVYEKYGCRCAYCGKEISYNQMEVDHYWPQHLQHMQQGLDNNRFDNLMPSCRKCNNFKSVWKPEDYRHELSMQTSRLMKNAQFCRALTFGQVKITENEIVFHFEELHKKKTEKKFCEWTRSFDGHFNIGCANETNTSGNGNFKSSGHWIAKWEFKHCPYCGLEIQIQEPDTTED